MCKKCSEWAVMLTTTSRFLKTNLSDFFLHFDPGQIYMAPKDVTHIEHPVTVVITAAFQQWLFNELFRSNSCHRVECMSHLFCTAILYILWMDKNKRFWLCVLLCVCVSEDLKCTFEEKAGRTQFIEFAFIPHFPPPTTPLLLPGEGGGAKAELCPAGDDGWSGPGA